MHRTVDMLVLTKFMNQFTKQEMRVKKVRAVVALRFPGGLGSQSSMTFGT